MSANGYTPIQIYYSTTALAVPVNTNLANGELAINITDGKLYYKDNSGTVQLLVSASGGVTTFSGSTTGLTPNTATSGAITLGGTLAVANGGTGVTSSTGTVAVVLSTSPTLITPNLGTPTALVGTNITGTATAFTASNVTTNANLTGGVTSVGNAATVVTNANLTGGVTSVGNAATVITNANLTGMVTSVGNAASLGSFTSAQLATALTDETGSGANVFATSPTLVTPLLGTPTSGVLTNCTGLPVAGGGTGVATLSGLAFGNATSAFTAATAAQVVAVISSTAVALATTATTANATATANDFQMNSLGVGTAGSATAGEIRATNNVTAYYTSDKQFKENIKPIVNALYIVEQIGGKTFDWTDDYVESHGGEDGYFVSKSDFGVVAQDVQAVFPKAVKVKLDGSLAVDYVKLSSLAFQAIIELSDRVKKLESK